MSATSYDRLSDTGDINEMGERTYTTTYQVFTDDIDDGPGAIAAVVPISIGASYSTPNETDTWAKLKKKTATQSERTNDGGMRWIVTLQYDTKPFAQGEGGLEPAGDPANADVAPDDRPWHIEMSEVTTEKLLTNDVNTNDPVVNAVGIPFDPVPTVPDYHAQFTITGYKAIIDDGFVNVNTYLGKINNALWNGFTTGKLLVRSYRLKSVYEQDSWWWEKTVVLEFNPNGWNPIKIANVSTVWRESMSLPLQPIRDKIGHPVTQPVPIGLDGIPLTAGEEIKYLNFDGYKTVDFTNLI